jgi:hypothetical protein
MDTLLLQNFFLFMPDDVTNKLECLSLKDQASSIFAARPGALPFKTDRLLELLLDILASLKKPP